MSAEGPAIRSRAVAFLNREFVTKATELLNGSTEVERQVADLVRHQLAAPARATPAEFGLFAKILSTLTIFKGSSEVEQELLDVSEQSTTLNSF
jgi:hypothetical protein